MLSFLALALFCAAAIVPAASVPQEERSGSLTGCLGGVSGLKVVAPGSPEYAADSASYNLRITVKPAAITYP
jgi:hypothetical protein